MNSLRVLMFHSLKHALESGNTAEMVRLIEAISGATQRMANALKVQRELSGKGEDGRVFLVGNHAFDFRGGGVGKKLNPQYEMTIPLAITEEEYDRLATARTRAGPALRAGGARAARRRRRRRCRGGCDPWLPYRTLADAYTGTTAHALPGRAPAAPAEPGKDLRPTRER